MPKAVFEKLKNKCEEEKESVEQALEDAYANRTDEVDYVERIVTLHEAIDFIMDDGVSGEAKNKLLKTIIKRIDYSREPAVRLSKEEAEEKGLETKNGWYTHDFELEIHFLI
jgi:malonyl CoA-acyl carrier protein transacylase